MTAGQSLAEMILAQPASWVIMALLAERVLPWSQAWHPLSLLTLLNRLIATRVIHQGRDQPSQQVLAGTLALLLQLTLTVVPAWWLLELAEFDQWLGMLILLISVQFQPHAQQLKRIQQALGKGQKNVARSMLRRLDARDTGSLSPLGIVRAAADQWVLGWFQQQLVVVLAFTLGGPLLALTVRVIIDCAQTWPYPLAVKFRYFGAVAEVLRRLVVTLPALLMIAGLQLVLLISGRGVVTRVDYSGWYWSDAWLLAGIAKLTQTPMGGPVKMRDSNGSSKRSRSRFGPAAIAGTTLQYPFRSISRWVTIASWVLMLIYSVALLSI